MWKKKKSNLPTPFQILISCPSLHPSPPIWSWLTGENLPSGALPLPKAELPSAGLVPLGPLVAYRGGKKIILSARWGAIHPSSYFLVRSPLNPVSSLSNTPSLGNPFLTIALVVGRIPRWPSVAHALLCGSQCWADPWSWWDIAPVITLHCTAKVKGFCRCNLGP